MIVYCPKCKSEYNAGAEYFGKSFRCGCGEIVFVEAPTPKNTPPQKPEATFPRAQTQKQAVKPAATPKPDTDPEPKKSAATAPASKKEAEAKVNSEEKKEKPPADEPVTESEKEKTRKTFYEMLIKAVCIVGILTEIVNFLVCFELAGNLAKQVPVGLSALPILVFIAIWCVSSVFLFLFFAALAALFRLADVACRSAGIRPFLF